VIDTGKKLLEFAGANRPLYVVRRNKRPGKGKGTELIHLRADRMPIGIYDEEPIHFSNHELPLQAGDTIYLFSDGFVDQLGGKSRKTFRSIRFRELLSGIQEHSMDEQKRILEKSLDSWRGEVEQIDDILVIGIRI